MQDFEKLEDLVLEKFNKESFKKLTPIQEKSYKAIIRKKNSLIVAPTGSGKTESAIIPVICMMSHYKERKLGIKCIYITPQRSLNNDVFRRIVKYAE
ncbi:MAG: DEAD/DEAH box helicase, partial [Candidatus Nitrosocosmicus sp.]